MVYRGSAGLGSVWRVMARHGPAGQGSPLPTKRGMVRHGLARRGLARFGTAGRGEAWLLSPGLGFPMSAARQEVDLRDDGPEVIVRAMITPDRAMYDFLEDGRRQGWSERTYSTYMRLLHELDARLPVDYDISDIREADIRAYLGSKGGRSRGTIAHAESVLSSFFRWCYLNRKIKTNPMDRIQRTRRIPATELDVTTVSTEDVPKLLAAAAALDLATSTSDREVWTHRVCLGVLTYMGPRRRAVARLRLRDYDRKATRMRFREKGAKIIWKPVPEELKLTLDAAIEAGEMVKPTDFLVPPLPLAWYDPEVLEGKRERDDRCVWDIVKAVGRKAGVETHVHALRAAFAVFYLEQNPEDIKGLQALLGHRNIATTAIYLRKANEEKAMEPVRTLSWGKA